MTGQQIADAALVLDRERREAERMGNRARAERAEAELTALLAS